MQKPVARTVQDTLVEETEASGSDALREYGPPKLEVSFDVNQGLPDVATEHTFFRASKEEVVEVDQEANVEGEKNVAFDIMYPSFIIHLKLTITSFKRCFKLAFYKPEPFLF